MKIIEAMKLVKSNKEKIGDLRARVQASCANLSNEQPLYGDSTAANITAWLKSIEDTGQQNIKLLVAIQKTNLTTSVTINLGGNNVTKTIAEWVWRRREYAEIDMASWRSLTDKNLKSQTIPQSTGQPLEIKVVRHYDPTVRDAKIDMYRNEPHAIDGTLEVINAVTDLVE